MSIARPSWADAPHLARRFLAAWHPRYLSPGEQAFVAGLLHPAERELFWNQQVMDLRHAHDCARYVAERRPGRPDLARAALLHDIGKRNARLGPLGRSIATVLAFLGMRGSQRHDSYNRHSQLGADMLADAGAEDVVVAYARHHHTGRPASFDVEEWDLLLTADRVN